MNCLRCGQPFPDYLDQIRKALDLAPEESEVVRGYVTELDWWPTKSLHSLLFDVYRPLGDEAEKAIGRIPDLQVAVRAGDDEDVLFNCDILACPECEDYGCRCRERISPEGFAEVLR